MQFQLAQNPTYEDEEEDITESDNPAPNEIPRDIQNYEFGLNTNMSYTNQLSYT